MSDDERTRESIDLYGQDAEWFQDLKGRITDQRGGHEPTNSEVLRMMMTQFDPDAKLRL